VLALTVSVRPSVSALAVVITRNRSIGAAGLRVMIHVRACAGSELPARSTATTCSVDTPRHPALSHSVMRYVVPGPSPAGRPQSIETVLPVVATWSGVTGTP